MMVSVNGYKGGDVVGHRAWWIVVTREGAAPLYTEQPVY